MQFYIDVRRVTEEHALPDAETFYVDYDQNAEALPEDMQGLPGSETIGWYWWACTPGCLPDSDPYGPFDSITDAINDARTSSFFL
jgi:hypothetical protein